MGEDESAVELTPRGAELAKAEQFASGEMCIVTLALSHSACQQDNGAEAHNLAVQALDIFRELDSIVGAADAFACLGHICYWQPEYFEAQEYYAQALVAHRTVGDRFGTANSLIDLGRLAWVLEDIDSAHRYLLESCAIRREIGDRWGMARSLFALATMAHELDDLVTAHDYFRQSLMLCHDLADRLGMIDALIGLSALAYDMDDVEVAQDHLREAGKIALALRSDHNTMRVILGFAWSRLAAGLPAVAAAYLSLVIVHARHAHIDVWRFNRLRMRLEHMPVLELADALDRGRYLNPGVILEEFLREVGVV
jgi:tetratricopeptide (TPR) repeat protein